ncbi:hypothetical protein HDU99_000659, partial [Rhizoclosmatium hyalinum]
WLGPGGVLEEDPLLLNYAYFDNPDDADDPFVLESTREEGICPGDFRANAVAKRIIRMNISEELYGVVQK